MRYAFLEIDTQELKENAQRDYSQFAEYYEKAEELYHEQVKDTTQMHRCSCLKMCTDRLRKEAGLNG